MMSSLSFINQNNGEDRVVPIIEDIHALLREPLEDPLVDLEAFGDAPASSTCNVVVTQDEEAQCSPSLPPSKKTKKKTTPTTNKNIDKPKMTRKPKRSLNTYNLFFQHHRRLIYDQVPPHAVVGFKGLATMISRRWKDATAHEKAHFERLAQEDKIRHKKEMEIWNQEQQEQLEAVRVAQEKADELQHLVTPDRMVLLAQALGDECLTEFVQLFK